MPDDDRTMPAGVPLTDPELSRDIACEAGALLLDLRESFGPIEDRVRADELRKLADRRAHELLAKRIGEARPDDALLTPPPPFSRPTKFEAPPRTGERSGGGRSSEGRGRDGRHGGRAPRR